MYSIDWAKVFSRFTRNNADANGVARTRPAISPVVWALGFTSLLTDISSEMVASVLPAYLVLHLGMSPLAFGLVDGIYQGAAALVRIVAGVLADRWRRHKEVAALGYGLSAACRLLIFAAGNAWGAIATIVAVDRVGKGIRTAPRDAMIAQSTKPEDLAAAFGTHRSLDAAGAMLGPILAFVLLAWLPNKFDILFVASFGVAVVGLGVILLFVPGGPATGQSASTHVASFASAVRLLRESRFRSQVIAGGLLGLATISDSFIFLVLQKRTDLGMTGFPLLYVGTSLATALCAAPVGRIADRFGRTQMLVVGNGVLLLVYLVLLLPVTSPWLTLGLPVALFGIYYAATDGVLTAMSAGVLPREHTGSGLSILATAVNVARLLGSICFGWLWTRWGTGPATVTYAGALILAIGVSAFMLRSTQRHVS